MVLIGAGNEENTCIYKFNVYFFKGNRFFFPNFADAHESIIQTIS